MRNLIALPALALLGACVFHVHVHETRSAAPQVPGPRPAEITPIVPAPAGSVSGIVHGPDHKPVRARVAAVGDSGSVSTGTDEHGFFELADLHWDEIVLHASTDDGRLAVKPVRTGTAVHVLVVRPASRLTVRFDGDADIRCALFQGSLRVEDFTLRPGQASRVVVPPGDVRVIVYRGDDTVAEQRVRVKAGETREVVFAGG